ncbi:hypothetical protein K474DRAFT_1657037 [Panus rudis PR-1116 ss-1]|nr:hypothetical protein K474DRAFT_1657037 [Panus rudis PR-1116 ss-1]
MDANRASRSFALNVAGLSRDDRRPNLHTRPESVSEDGNGQALNVAKEIKSFLRALQKLDEISSRSHGFIKIPTACGETRSALIIIYCILEDNVLVFNSIFQPSALDYDLVIREDMRPMVINHLPPILDNLANALRELRRYLSELPMFRADELLNSLLTMEMNLRTNAQGLEALEEYYNSSKGEDTFQLTQNLQTFLNEGISVVEKEEKDESKMMLNLSSVATLFSATTAAALQIALTGDLNLLVELAVCFWFISLILSVAVALNVLFGLAVKQTRSKSLRKPVPLWITIWIDNSPPLFLAFSAACFAIGLTLFVYASSKRAFFTKIAFTVVFVSVAQALHTTAT